MDKIMRSAFQKSSMIVAVALASTAYSADKTLEQRVEDLEFASYSNTVKWSGFFTSRYDAVTYENDGGTKDSYNFHRMLGGIDFSANPTDRVSVFGRLTMGKFYNNQPDVVPAGGSTTITGSRRYADDGVARFERLFVNYKLGGGVALSLGRLPTVDGPPNHIYDGRSRLGTYPSQLYSSVLDGYAVTYTPSLGDNQTLAIRYILSPLMNIGQNGASYKFYEVDNIPGSTSPDEDVRDINSWMIDYSLAGSAIARNVNFIYQGLQFEKLKVTQTNEISYTRHTAYLELSEIVNSGLSLYLSSSMTSIKSEGPLVVGVNPATGALIVTSILSNTPDETAKGSNLVVGLNYKLSQESLMNPLFGAEFVQGSKKYNNFDFTSDMPFGFYDVRGQGYQVYYTQPLATGTSLRIGYVASESDQSEGLIGEPVDREDKMTSVYANLRVDF